MARRAVWLCVFAAIVACSGPSTASTDAGASAAIDGLVFTFTDASGTDAAATDAAVGTDAAADADAGTDAFGPDADAGTDAAADADAGTDVALDAAVDAAADTAPDANAAPDVPDAPDVTVPPDAGCVPGLCPPADAPCQVAICQPDGTCGFASAADGASCDDANACTGPDNCQAGACIGAATSCDDGNTCTIDSCKAAIGCIHAFDNSPCQDGNGCTVGDECVSGACVPGAPVVCTASDACHAAGTCAPATGSCPSPGLPDGTSCGATQVCMASACVFADALPAGTLAWFTTADCPSGWDVEPLAVGRTVVPSDAAGNGQLDATALSPGENRVHGHSVSGSITTNSVSFVGIGSCCNAGLSPAGTWDVSGSALPASSGIPYVQLRACKKTTAIAFGDAPAGLVAFLDGSGCPDAWTSAAAGLLRFIVGTPAGGTTGATFGGTWAAVHSHSVSANVVLASHGIALASGCCGGGYAAAGTFGFSATSDGGSSGFPSLRRLACTAPGGSAPGPVPSGLVASFTASSCPSGWSPATAAAGRLVVGAADGSGVGVQVGIPLGDQEDRSHSHGVSLNLQPPVKSVAGANGGNGQAADNAATEASSQSGAAASGMPFVQWQACQKD